MEDRLQTILEKLRERNFRLTPQRLAVVRILATSLAHPSAEQIYTELRQEFPTLSLATVYKTAHLLKEMGELTELAMKDGSSRFDGNKPYPHPHVICAHCKTVIDVDADPLDALASEVARQTGYRIFSHRLDFFGLCPECQHKRDRARMAS